MRKRLFAALRWIEKSHKNTALKVAERTESESNPESDPDSDLDLNLWDSSEHEHAMAYTEAELAARMGAEEWFLACEMNSTGALRSEEDITTTYSLSLSPEGFAKVRCYDMRRNINGNHATVETDSKTGTWEITQRMLTLHLPDESLEFIVARIEGGVAILVDSDDGSCSVLMTEAALNEELESDNTLFCP